MSRSSVIATLFSSCFYFLKSSTAQTHTVYIEHDAIEPDTYKYIEQPVVRFSTELYPEGDPQPFDPSRTTFSVYQD